MAASSTRLRIVAAFWMTLLSLSGLHDLDDLLDVFFPRKGDQVRAIARRLGHEPDAHLGDDAEVRLREDAIHVRAEPVLEQLPGIVARHRAHTGPHDLSIRKNDLHATLHHEVIAIRCVTHAVVERISHDAAPAGIRDVEPQFQPAPPDVVVQVEVTDARLDEGVAEFFVHLQDAVHPVEIDNDGAGQDRGGPAIGEILAAGDRPQRDTKLAGDLDDLLHLLGCGRCDRGMGLVPRVVVGDRVRIVVAHDLLAREHPFAADDLPESLQGIGHAISSYTWR